MQLKTSFFLIFCAIYYNYYNFAKPLIGVNRRDARENEFPYVVSILKSLNITANRLECNHKCTGTLVSNRDVLTAAHCLRDAMTTPIKVMIGSVNLDQSTEYYPIFTLSYDNWALHRRVELLYSNNDVAFVKLINCVPDNIPNAFIGNMPNNIMKGLNVVTAGWGRLENHTLPKILQTVPLKVISQKDCEYRISMATNGWIAMDDSYICSVGETYTLINNGDSGGPLLYNGFIIGVNAGVCDFLGMDGEIQEVNIHISLRYYQTFIHDVTTNYDV